MRVFMSRAKRKHKQMNTSRAFLYFNALNPSYTRVHPGFPIPVITTASTAWEITSQRGREGALLVSAGVALHYGKEGEAQRL